MTYGPARAWAPDCQPLRIRSTNLENPKSADGKAGVWEVTYVSQARGRARRYIWSAIDSGDSLRKGVFGEREEPWSGPGGLEQPFVTPAIKIDTPEALKTAIEKSSDYLKQPGKKPPITFVLESTPRFPDPVWRVLWGTTASAAEWTVFVDASTGQFRGN
jgi:hypothetical protein